MNIYDEMYDKNGINYGEWNERDHATERETLLYSDLTGFLSQYKADTESTVLEIGCSVGFNHNCHPKYTGIEYSQTAVDYGKKRFGSAINIKQGDATKLSFPDEEFNFIFSYAVLEHIPNILGAFNEIDRVLAKGGIAYLTPAWNCRIWTVQKLNDFTYKELPWGKKIAKFLIPIRESLAFRFATNFPLRLTDELKLFFGYEPSLRYRDLPVNIDLIKRFGHVADDDAYINIDAHSALMFFASKGYKMISHPTIISRLFSRGDGIIVRKV